MPATPDGVYDNRPWNRKPDWSYLRPWASNEERLTQQALEAATTPGSVLMDSVRPPLDQVMLFRPRFGYRTRTLSVEDIIDMDRAVNPARQDYSGSDAGPTGGSRYSYGSGNW